MSLSKRARRYVRVQRAVEFALRGLIIFAGAALVYGSATFFLWAIGGL